MTIIITPLDCTPSSRWNVKPAKKPKVSNLEVVAIEGNQQAAITQRQVTRHVRVLLRISLFRTPAAALHKATRSRSVAPSHWPQGRGLHRQPGIVAHERASTGHHGVASSAQAVNARGRGPTR